jgi:RNA polymerase sigma factor (TIGR02999 family)
VSAKSLRHSGGLRYKKTPPILRSAGLSSQFGSAGKGFSRNWPVTSAAVILDHMTEVTRILSAVEKGDSHAASELLPLVYDELRKLAAQKLAQENPGQTLQATALVHEAYLRLVDVDKAQYWDSRGHFFAAAAEAMRRILIDNARRRRSQRRGGQAQRHSLEGLQSATPGSDDELLAVDEALQRLHKLDPSKAELVKLRYFGGLTIPEAAQSLGISATTANRYWAYARAWLHEELAAGSGPISD